jgi:POT family proton-dependent oligopeptide transporter
VRDKPLLGVPQGILIPILAFVCAPLVALMLASYEPIANGSTIFGDQNLVNVIFKAIGVLILIYLAKVLYDATLEERKKLFVAILISFFMTIFWGFHELSGSVITLFAARNVDLSFMDAAQTNSLNSMFIIILAIPISLMWAYLAKTKRNPRTPYKFGLGLVFAGLSFYVLSISGLQANEEGLVPFSYLLVMYFLLSIGELFMSPVGLSKITDLSPKRIVAFMMGIWFLSSAYAFQVVGFISKELAVESDNANVGGLETLSIYTEGFELIAMYSLGAGVFVLLSSPFIKKLMGKVH